MMYNVSMVSNAMPCIKYNVSRSLLRDTMYLTSKVARHAGGVHPQEYMQG